MGNNTKDKIMAEALNQFAEKGYAGTSLQEIADVLGITKAALYRHFSGKEDIWNKMIDELEVYYAQTLGEKKENLVIPNSVEELIALSMSQVKITVNDEKIAKARKLLTLSQFQDNRIAALVSKHFLYEMEDFYAMIFEKMAQNGILREGDYKLLAFSYTAPITQLIQLCDREPQKKEEVIKQIQCFVEAFVYSCKRKNI